MPYADPERQREYMRQWVAARRQQWIAESGPCFDCGTWDDLQVDHVDASTKITHRVWSWSATRRARELAKCVVRCGPCHRAKTRRMKEAAHGEANGNAKLSAENVLVIRASGEDRNVLASRYGISKWNVDRVRRTDSSGSWRDL